MRPVVYVMLGVAPFTALVMYLYFKNRYQRDFGGWLVKSFLAGAVSIVVLMAAEYLSMKLGLNSLQSLKRMTFYSFITIAASSEFGKFLVFRYYIMTNKRINRPIDAVTFAIMTSLGFSSIALFLFVFNYAGIQANFPVTLYTLVFVPANVIFSVIMGFFIGMAKVLKARIMFSLTGLFGAVFFHGVFNFCMLTNDFKLLSLFSFGSTLIVLVLGLKAASSNPEPSGQ
ncbi:MAG: PrsW family glutamic-type intramembrane protease [bacterium]